MTDIDFIAFLESLTPEDWDAQVTSMWTVKDVVSHMIGWEKRDPEIIEKTWATKELPWWITTKEDYDAFNQESVEFYKNYTPKQLIEEWKFWQNEVRKTIETIGEDNLRSRLDLFGWLFEGEGSGNDPDDDLKDSHYEHHYKQIKNILKK